MTLLRKPGARFLIEMTLIVVTALLTLKADARWWTIIGFVFGAWVLCALFELAVSQVAAPAPATAGFAPSEPPAQRSARKPRPARKPKPAGRRERPERTRAPSRNVGIVDGSPVATPEPTDAVEPERSESPGALPADFDGLVRESFGDLLLAETR